MSRAGVATAVFSLVLWSAVPAAAGGPETASVLLPDNPLAGSRLFASKGCLICHAVHGSGGNAGPDLGRGVLSRPLLEIAAVMWNHAPGMEQLFQDKGIARPRFEAAELASLLAFLYYLGSLDPPGDADRGAVIFRQKGCETCHSVGGVGGRVGPRLDPYSRYASPLFLTAALWNRGSGMAAAMTARNIARPAFQGDDIPNLLAYIRSVGGAAERIYAPPGRPKRGAALFTAKRCVECHAVRGQGGTVGPDLAIVLSGSITRIAGAMWNHGPGMWARMVERNIEVPALGPEEMSDLISYLYFLQFIDSPGNARRGAAVFKDKRCGSCHGAATAGAAAPPLPVIARELKTPLEVVTAMWNHAGRMTEMTLIQNVAWPALKGGEMADLIAYLLEAQETSSPPPRGARNTGGRQ